MQSEEDSDSLSEFEATIGSDCSDSETDSSKYGETSSDENNETSQDEMEVDEPSNLPSDLGNVDWGLVSVSERQYVYTDEEKILEEPCVDNEDGVVEPIDVYNMFVTNEIMSFIVEQTNLYAQQTINSRTLTRKSRLKKWVPTNTDELRKFIGLVIAMGLNHKPSIDKYWSNFSLYEQNFFPKVMSRDRFLLILRFIHFNDNESISTSDRLHKIRPLITHCSQKFKSVYNPGEKFVIDESLMPFRGRLGFRQYIPNKTHKYGVKFYKLCSPNSYTWNFDIYQGRMSREASFNHSESIVLQLSADILDRGCIIYGDNYYSSIPLAKRLLQRKTYYCGTLRKNRKGIPNTIKSAKLKKGEIISAMNEDNIKLYCWKDQRDVHMLSTVPEHGDDLCDTGKKTRSGVAIKKPKCVIAYNETKKGVDMSDQLAAYNTSLRKNTKWYRKVAFELLTATCVVNSFVLYNKYFCLTKKKFKITEFKENITMSLTGTSICESTSLSSKRATTSKIEGPRTNHQLIENKKIRKRCVFCYEQIKLNEGLKMARNRTRRVHTFCEDCAGKPFLCVSCFNTKHTG